MATRVAVALSLSIGLAACANDKPLSAALATHESAALTAASVTPAEPSALPKKTMSDRVLAAIALERVTGLKPDPARLVQ